MSDANEQTDAKLQLLISWTLRVGVLTAGGVGLLGGALFFASRPGPADFHLFRGAALPYAHLDQLFAQLLAPQTPLPVRGLSLIQLGILILLLTPALRVLLSVVGFALERDRLYVLITLGVLLVLLLSMWLQ